MTLSLNVLNHLGIGLYSNVPAVLSEAIANAWDADANRVEINIDTVRRRITISDDGVGMTVEDANAKYLTVGYARRDAGENTSASGRRVMGRKGIGKLSLFSVADTVEVHSVKDGECHGLRMRVPAIRAAMASGRNSEYHPEAIDPNEIALDRGTRIILTDMKRRLNQTGRALRRRLARRFSVMGSEHQFAIYLDGTPIRIEDREYHNQLQYIWTFGPKGQELSSIARNVEHAKVLSPVVSPENGQTATHIDGWIGTVHKPGDLKDQSAGENINGIVVMVRGKLAQENILDEFGDEDIYSEYVIGEIHADFLDQDHLDDIATSSRQRIIEEDPRYQALKSTLGDALKIIQADWRQHRNQGGRRVATMIPQIKEWYESLTPDHKNSAERLFGRINQLSIPDDAEKRRIFIGAILAFESLKFRNLLSKLDTFSASNMSALADVFTQLDDLEQSAYYQITKDRIEVIRKLTDLVDDNAKERAIQEHLYKHLWLLDPSWERATHTEQMERQIRNVLDGSQVNLSQQEKESRLDIYYATTGNRHVIIELKRASASVRTSGLYAQLERYHGPATRILESHGKGNEPLEFICVIGKRPPDWDDRSNGRRVSQETLGAINARIVMYDELIQNALEAYQDYVDRAEEAGRVYRLIRSIENADAEMMSPEPG